MQLLKRKKYLKIAITALLIAVMIAPIILNSITAHAGSMTEGYSDDGSYTTSGGKWYATYATGCGYKGQGVLVYLLERNGGGAVAGTTPKAFRCSNGIWHCQNGW